MINMEKYTPTTTSSSADDSSNMNSAMVDKIADIFAQINAKKAEVRLMLLVVYILYFKLDVISPTTALKHKNVGVRTHPIEGLSLVR